MRLKHITLLFDDGRVLIIPDVLMLIATENMGTNAVFIWRGCNFDMDVHHYVREIVSQGSITKIH